MLLAVSIWTGALCAEEITSNLARPQSAEFGGHLYEVFEFESDGADGALVGALSSAFDAYIVLAGPAATLLQNDDAGGILPEAGSNDSALAIPKEIRGRWLAFVTSYGEGETGDFRFHHQGVRDVRRLNPSAVDRAEVERAFAERGVTSSETRERERRADHERRITALTDQLTLSSFRANVRREIRSRDESTLTRAESVRSDLVANETREQELGAALAEIESVPTIRPLVRELLRRDLLIRPVCS
jgi:hypothetical protein